ncbi:hypothetical protein [Haloarcula litorea]|uniref:hypothetical protein n=1 Tax=Haloarcula litorea TaxID=3032579 RepID=UPI0023E89FEF|nr:hypothetical protein [Halomicroarcula sp. GDY20]
MLTDGTLDGQPDVACPAGGSTDPQRVLLVAAPVAAVAAGGLATAVAAVATAVTAVTAVATAVSTAAVAATAAGEADDTGCRCTVQELAPLHTAVFRHSHSVQHLATITIYSFTAPRNVMNTTSQEMNGTTGSRFILP